MPVDLGLTGWAVWLRGRYLGEAWGSGLTAEQAISDPMFGIASHHRRFGQAVRVESLEEPVPAPEPPVEGWTEAERRRKLHAIRARAAQQAEVRSREIDEIDRAWERDKHRLTTLRAATPDDQLVWMQYTIDRIPGRWHAYGATRYGIGLVTPDGSWEWSGHADGGSQERGEAADVTAAQRLIEQRWAAAIAKAPKALSAAQKLAAYRRTLIGRVQSSGHEDQYRAIEAIEALERCGWLDRCPMIHESWIGYMSERLIRKLKRLNKLPAFDDVF